tara:strand:+ start:445 stop:684 length:240 start_codon:yes stop_codon:yes gene_type:complete
LDAQKEILLYATLKVKINIAICNWSFKMRIEREKGAEGQKLIGRRIRTKAEVDKAEGRGMERGRRAKAKVKGEKKGRRH